MIHSFMWYMHSSRDAVSQVVCCALQTKKKNEFDPETIPWVKRGGERKLVILSRFYPICRSLNCHFPKTKKHLSLKYAQHIVVQAWTIPMLPEANNEGNWQATIGDNDTFFRCKLQGWILNHREKRLCTAYRIPNYTQNKPRVVSQTSYKS